MTIPRSLSALLVVLIAGPTATLVAQNDDKACSEFLKAIRQTQARSKTVTARAEAMSLLAGLDSLAVAKALVKASNELSQELTALDAERAVVREELVKIEKMYHDPATGGLRAPADVQAKWKELGRRAGEFRGPIDDARSLGFTVNDRLLELKDKAALVWLLESVVGNKKLDTQLRLIAAQAAGGGGPEMLPDLQRAVTTAKQPTELLALMDAFALMGTAARPAAPLLIKLMQHKEEPIRERAALALSKVAVIEAVLPMIELLAQSSGQVQKRIAASLEVLTGEGHGVNAATWRRWYAAEGPASLAKRELGKGSPSAHEEFNKKNYYFGIPQDGKSIVYIIDASGSMSKQVSIDLTRKRDDDKKGKGTSAQPRDQGDGNQNKKTTTRLEACKTELIAALGRLAPDTKFNVLWFSSEPHMHLPKMTKAAPAAIKTAQDWVRQLKPNGSTNIHDTLQMSFTLTGRGNKDKAYAIDFDTIFLLTDGSPTLPPGDKLDSTEKIVKAARTWNPLKRVVIHCIGIGDGVNRQFMQQLASENNGEFKHILD